MASVNLLFSSNLLLETISYCSVNIFIHLEFDVGSIVSVDINQ